MLNSRYDILQSKSTCGKKIFLQLYTFVLHFQRISWLKVPGNKNLHLSLVSTLICLACTSFLPSANFIIHLATAYPAHFLKKNDPTGYKSKSNNVKLAICFHIGEKCLVNCKQKPLYNRMHFVFSISFKRCSNNT